MNLDETEIRRLIGGTLLFFLVVVAVLMWFVDVLMAQMTFGMLISVELMAFSLLIYTSLISNLNRVNISWLLIGCFALALLLILTLIVS
jgi:hypothetical protein